MDQKKGNEMNYHLKQHLDQLVRTRIYHVQSCSILAHSQKQVRPFTVAMTAHIRPFSIFLTDLQPIVKEREIR